MMMYCGPVIFSRVTARIYRVGATQLHSETIGNQDRDRTVLFLGEPVRDFAFKLERHAPQRRQGNQRRDN